MLLYYLLNALLHLTKVHLKLQVTANGASYNPSDVPNNESTDCFTDCSSDIPSNNYA